jgi:hypothetical protein
MRAPERLTRDGTIVRVPECHCYGCEAAALGLRSSDPRGDLRTLGWRLVSRRWHCEKCVAATVKPARPSA